MAFYPALTPSCFISIVYHSQLALLASAVCLHLLSAGKQLLHKSVLYLWGLWVSRDPQLTSIKLATLYGLRCEYAGQTLRIASAEVELPDVVQDGGDPAVEASPRDIVYTMPADVAGDGTGPQKLAQTDLR